ncbi:MAG: AAA family ATPase [Proteobacteria bacterium]|nr:AAA family ATPase [Pseudomonadota bacterium]
MFTELHIRNFRGFEKLSLFRFSRLNFITGRNGTGKTSILEALFLLSGGAKPELVFVINKVRREDRFDVKSDWAFRGIFKNLSHKNPIQLSTKEKKKSKSVASTKKALEIRPILRTVPILNSSASATAISGLQFDFGVGNRRPVTATLKFNPALMAQIEKANPSGIPAQGITLDEKGPLISEINGKNDLVRAQIISASVYVDPKTLHDQVVSLVKQRRISEIVEVLKLIEKDVRDVVPLTENGLPMVLIDLGIPGQLVPLSLLGEGFNKLLGIAIAMVVAENGIVLIDEIENGFHFSFFSKLIDFINRIAAQKGIQVFMTSHSGEFLSHVAVWAKEEKASADVSLTRVWRDKEGNRGTTQFDGRELFNADGIGLELR